MLWELQRTGLVSSITKEGYAFQMLLVVYSKDDIQVKYILDKEATESVQEDVILFFFESVKNNNLDSKSFNLKVADRNDGRDW